MGAAAKKAQEQAQVIAAELSSVRSRLAEVELHGGRRLSQRNQQLREQLDDRRHLLEHVLNDLQALAANADD
jgi:hypothetical protein